MVKNVAKHVQAMDKWHNHLVVSRLQFKDHWTHSFLTLHGMRRKRVTADCKGNWPIDVEIRATMERWTAPSVGPRRADKGRDQSYCCALDNEEQIHSQFDRQLRG
eukprot:205978-Rhodomonas_salina.2